MDTLGYDDFSNLILENQGLYRTTMAVLRDAHGVGKLGVHVRTGITNELKNRGIGTLPPELPSYQHEEVRLYKLGSPIADVIDAVHYPSDTGDEALRRSMGSDAEEVLAQVRQLVCD